MIAVPDGLELLALAYGWPPGVGRALDVAEYRAWCERAQRTLKARAGLR